jgi:hypothetical protein
LEYTRSESYVEIFGSRVGSFFSSASAKGNSYNKRASLLTKYSSFDLILFFHC